MNIACPNALFPLREAHKSEWEKIKKAIQNERIPQALLLVGPQHIGVLTFAYRLIAHLLCHSVGEEVCQCQSCHFLSVGTHPDLLVIQSSPPGSAIKIQQIRSLQEEVYQTAKSGLRRTILIEGAEKLNTAAANALLKILEEPPVGTYFVLVAEQLGTLPLTIISRCSRIVFPDTLFDASHYLRLGEHYPPTSKRAELYHQRLAMIHTLTEIAHGKISPCDVAKEWSDSYSLSDITWMLYLILAEVIHMQLRPLPTHVEERQALVELTKALSSLQLFKLLDAFNRIQRNSVFSIAYNALLVLEDVLIEIRNPQKKTGA